MVTYEGLGSGILGSGTLGFRVPRVSRVYSGLGVKTSEFLFRLLRSPLCTGFMVEHCMLQASERRCSSSVSA